MPIANYDDTSPRPGTLDRSLKHLLIHNTPVTSDHLMGIFGMLIYLKDEPSEDARLVYLELLDFLLWMNGTAREPPLWFITVGPHTNFRDRIQFQTATDPLEGAWITKYLAYLALQVMYVVDCRETKCDCRDNFSNDGVDAALGRRTPPGVLSKLTAEEKLSAKLTSHYQIVHCTRPLKKDENDDDAPPDGYFFPTEKQLEDDPENTTDVFDIESVRIPSHPLGRTQAIHPHFITSYGASSDKQKKQDNEQSLGKGGKIQSCDQVSEIALLLIRTAFSGLRFKLVPSPSPSATSSLPFEVDVIRLTWTSEQESSYLKEISAHGTKLGIDTVAACSARLTSIGAPKSLQQFGLDGSNSVARFKALFPQVSPVPSKSIANDLVKSAVTITEQLMSCRPISALIRNWFVDLSNWALQQVTLHPDAGDIPSSRRAIFRECFAICRALTLEWRFISPSDVHASLIDVYRDHKPKRPSYYYIPSIGPAGAKAGPRTGRRTAPIDAKTNHSLRDRVISERTALVKHQLTILDAYRKSKGPALYTTAFGDSEEHTTAASAAKKSISSDAEDLEDDDKDEKKTKGLRRSKRRKPATDDGDRDDDDDYADSGAVSESDSDPTDSEEEDEEEAGEKDEDEVDEEDAKYEETVVKNVPKRRTGRKGKSVASEPSVVTVTPVVAAAAVDAVAVPIAAQAPKKRGRKRKHLIPATATATATAEPTPTLDAVATAAAAAAADVDAAGPLKVARTDLTKSPSSAAAASVSKSDVDNKLSVASTMATSVASTMATSVASTMATQLGQAPLNPPLVIRHPPPPMMMMVQPSQQPPSSSSSQPATAATAPAVPAAATAPAVPAAALQPNEYASFRVQIESEYRAKIVALESKRAEEERALAARQTSLSPEEYALLQAQLKAQFDAKFAVAQSEIAYRTQTLQQSTAIRPFSLAVPPSMLAPAPAAVAIAPNGFDGAPKLKRRPQMAGESTGGSILAFNTTPTPPSMTVGYPVGYTKPLLGAPLNMVRLPISNSIPQPPALPGGGSITTIQMSPFTVVAPPQHQPQQPQQPHTMNLLATPPRKTPFDVA